MDRCVLLASTPSCFVNNTHPSMINPLNDPGQNHFASSWGLFMAAFSIYWAAQKTFFVMATI